MKKIYHIIIEAETEKDIEQSISDVRGTIEREHSFFNDEKIIII